MSDFKTFAVKVMGMTDDEAAALLDADGNITDDVWAALAKKDKERVKRITEDLKADHKTEITDKFNEGHAKAKREERSKYEDEIREAFGVQSKSMGLDLIKDVVATGNKEDVKTHPDYIALEKKLREEYVPAEDFTVVKGEYDAYKARVERDKVFSRVKADGKAQFYSMNPVLSKDKKRALNQETEFLNKLEGYNYQLAEDGNHIVLDKEGKRMVNENLNPITFPDLVKNLTLSYFDVQEQEPSGGTGFDTPPAGTPPAQTWKTKQEFNAAYANEGNPEKASKMFEAAKAQGFISS